MSSEDNSSDLLDAFQNAQPFISYLFNAYLTLFCVLSGSILNLVSIVIFLRFRQGSNTTIIQCYLVALTLWQTALLFSAFFLYCLPTLIYGRVILQGNYAYIYPFAYFFSNLSHTGTVWWVLALTCDRFFALCRPLTHLSIDNRERLKRLIIAVSISAVIFTIPRFFEVAVVEICRNDLTSNTLTEECVKTVDRTSLTPSTIYWRIYRIFLNSIFVTIGPCFLLCVLTFRISLELNKSGQRRKSLSASECQMVGDIRKNSASSGKSLSRDHRANMILVIVILKSTLTNLLPSIFDVVEHIIGEEVFRSSSLATIIVDFSNFLFVLNCSTNFWIFLFWSRRFRQNCCYFLLGSRLGTAFAKLVNLESEFASMTAFNAVTTHTRNNFISSTDLAAHRRCSFHESAAFLMTGNHTSRFHVANRRSSEMINSINRSERARSCTDDFVDRQRLL